MKKSGILNPQLMKVIAEMGHTDGLVIADAGLPVPPHIPRIDLALRCGLPGFLEVLHAVQGELQVESSVIASDMERTNPGLYRLFMENKRTSELAIPDGFELPPDISTVPHKSFKELTTVARAVVRSGECTPHANIILYSGVTF